jgi:Bacterial regulatory proteins, lacI family
MLQKQHRFHSRQFPGLSINEPNVSDQIKQRVLRAIDYLEYRPNVAA